MPGNCCKRIAARVKQKFISGIRSEETGGLLNYYTLQVRDKAITDEIICVFERKLDALNWVFYPMMLGVIILNLANYIAKVT